MRGRLLLGLPGVLVGLYGLYLLLELGLDNLLDTAVWAVGGVIAHDGLLAPAVLLVSLVAMRTLPAAVRAPAAVAGIVLGSLTLVAVPVLGRFGARSDNPSLLDRPYVAAWLVLAGLTLIGVVLAGVVRARGTTGSGDGQSPRGR